jgi:alpha-tubulin suppressor-like RCC1 family protein
MAGNKRMIRKRKSRGFSFLLACITVFSMFSSTEYKKKSSQTEKTEAKVAAGGDHTCAIKQDGSLWCWGNNFHGQLGDGTVGFGTSKNTPVKIIESEW